MNLHLDLVLECKCHYGTHLSMYGSSCYIRSFELSMLLPCPGLSAANLKLVQGSITLSVAALSELPPTAQELARIEAEEAAAMAEAAESGEGGNGAKSPLPGVLPPAVAPSLASRYAQQTARLALRSRALQPGVTTAQLLAQGKGSNGHGSSISGGVRFAGAAPVPNGEGGTGRGNGSTHNGGANDDVDDVDSMPAELRLAVLRQYAPAVPIVVAPSEMHEVNDRSRAPFVMAPLLGNGGLGVGVLSVRMATSLSSTPGGAGAANANATTCNANKGVKGTLNGDAPQLMNPLSDELAPEPYHEWRQAKVVATKSALQAVKDRAAVAAEQERKKREKEASEAAKVRAEEDKVRAAAARKKREANAGRAKVGRRGIAPLSNAPATKKKKKKKQEEDDEDDSSDSDDAENGDDAKGASETEDAAESLDGISAAADGMANESNRATDGDDADAVSAGSSAAVVDETNALAVAKDSVGTSAALASPLVSAPVPIPDPKSDAKSEDSDKSLSNKGASSKRTLAAAAKVAVAVVKQKPSMIAKEEEELMSSPIPLTDPLRGYLEGTPGLPMAALDSFLTASSDGGSGSDSGGGALLGTNTGQSTSLSSPLRTRNTGGSIGSGSGHRSEHDGEEVSWEALLKWARVQGDDGSMPRDPDFMDADVVMSVL